MKHSLPRSLLTRSMRAHPFQKLKLSWRLGQSHPGRQAKLCYMKNFGKPLEAASVAQRTEQAMDRVPHMTDPFFVLAPFRLVDDVSVQSVPTQPRSHLS